MSEDTITTGICADICIFLNPQNKDQHIT